MRKIITNLLGVGVAVVGRCSFRTVEGAPEPGMGTVTRMGPVAGMGAVTVVNNRRTSTFCFPQIEGFVRGTR